LLDLPTNTSYSVISSIQENRSKSYQTVLICSDLSYNARATCMELHPMVT
jgi:hypothetical protein